MFKFFARFWEHVLALPTGLGPRVEAPEAGEPDTPKVVEPNAERTPPADEAHKWKSHGGFRH